MPCAASLYLSLCKFITGWKLHRLSDYQNDLVYSNTFVKQLFIWETALLHDVPFPFFLFWIEGNRFNVKEIWRHFLSSIRRKLLEASFTRLTVLRWVFVNPEDSSLLKGKEKTFLVLQCRAVFLQSVTKGKSTISLDGHLCRRWLYSVIAF